MRDGNDLTIRFRREPDGADNIYSSNCTVEGLSLPLLTGLDACKDPKSQALGIAINSPIMENAKRGNECTNE